MQQFDLSLWLQDKSRKIVTRSGVEAEIIHDKYPLVAIINGVAYNFDNDGKFQSNRAKHPYDLFFVDEELTEFEKELQTIISEASHWTSDDGSISTYCQFGDKEIKKISVQLLDLARKELQPEFDKEMDKMLAETDKVVYQKGREDALKDLPKWKKDYFHNITWVVDGTLYYNGYYIDIKELIEKLPKEE